MGTAARIFTPCPYPHWAVNVSSPLGDLKIIMELNLPQAHLQDICYVISIDVCVSVCVTLFISSKFLKFKPENPHNHSDFEEAVSCCTSLSPHLPFGSPVVAPLFVGTKLEVSLTVHRIPPYLSFIEPRRSIKEKLSELHDLHLQIVLSSSLGFLDPLSLKVPPVFPT